MGDDWIIVPNWDRFQHYKDRQPTWIKLYTELNSNPDWLGLADSQRGLLVTLWLEFARSRGQLAAHQVRAITGLRNVYQSLRPLADAGFIELSASKPLALARSREKRREEKKVRAKALTQVASKNDQPKTPSERPRDPIWDTLVEECGKPATESERGRYNKAVKQLREVKATPAQMRSAMTAYRREWPHLTLTPTALAGNWSRFANATAMRPEHRCPDCGLVLPSQRKLIDHVEHVHEMWK